MKRKMFYRFAALMIAVMSYVGLNAQTITRAQAQPSSTTPHVVTPGSNHIYDVDYVTRSAGAKPNSYVWDVRLSNAGGADLGAATGAGTDYTVNGGAIDAAQFKINFVTAGYRLVRVQESNNASFGSCAGTLETFLVNVQAGTIIFTSATGTDGCPQVTTAYSPALTVTNVDAASYPITVNVTYKINGVDQAPVDLTVAAAGNPLPIPAGADFLNNTTANDDLTRTVTINSAHDKYNGTITVGGTTANHFSVWALPQTKPITHD